MKPTKTNAVATGERVLACELILSMVCLPRLRRGALWVYLASGTWTSKSRWREVQAHFTVVPTLHSAWIPVGSSHSHAT
jgi:hypothetical protein